MKYYDVCVSYNGYDSVLNNKICNLLPDKYDGCGYNLESSMREHLFFKLIKKQADSLYAKAPKLSSYYNIDVVVTEELE